MLRIVIGRPGPDDGPAPVVALARALRDGGHEVIHAGAQDDAEALAAAAVQEDVDVVALVTGDDDAAGMTTRLRRLLVDRGADDIEVLAGAGPTEVLARVAELT
jgi:methylmalonyl-CoA mutase C-terminal domain/subunit